MTSSHELSRDSAKAIEKIFALVGIASPLIWIGYALVAATYTSYGTRYITDPGHARIRLYDGLVSITTLTLTIAAIAYSFEFSLERFSEAVNLDFPESVFATQFSGLESTVLLYVISILLYVYRRKRAHLIAHINTKAGYW